MRDRSRVVARAALAGAVLLAGACRRRSGEADIGPVPSFETSSGATDAGMVTGDLLDAADDPWAPRRPVGRKPVLVEVDGEPTSVDYAPAAAPTPEHPRGTIANLAFHFVQSSAGQGTYDASLVEVDLATAATIRRIPLGAAVDRAGVFEGARGPIVNVTRGREETVVWFDPDLSELARRVWRSPHLDSWSGVAAGGDRIALAYFDRYATTVALIDSRGTVVRRVCPGESGSVSESIALWRGYVVVTGLGAITESRLCLFRADGSGGVTSRRFPDGSTVFAERGELYVRASEAAAPGLGIVPRETYEMGPDLRPTGAPVTVPEGLPEETEAERIVGLTSQLRAHLVSGTIVLQAIGCCGEKSALYLLDPHAD
jgi:hypothetical protein